MKRFKQNIASAVLIIFVAAFTLLFFLLPKSSYSENEKRVLADMPEFGFDTLLNGEYREGVEDHINDHFPFRNFFMGVNSYFGLLTGRNGASGVYLTSDGYLINTPTALDREQAERNIGYLKRFSDDTGLPSSIMIVSDTGYILSDKFNIKREYFDDELFELIEEKAEGMNIIDLREAFSSSDEQIYYRTDHHVTSAGAYLMYRSFCQSSGIDPTEFKKTQTFDGFYGTCYSKSGLWGVAPDEVEQWIPDHEGDFTVTITDRAIDTVYTSLYFPEYLEKMDMYPYFLGGNHEIVTVKNNSCTNGKKLLLVKDSYAHCFATFLAEDYEEIIMVDFRYYKGSGKGLVEKYAANEILYLFGAENLASSTNISGLIFNIDRDNK